MTNTQKWVALFVAAFAILFFLTRITRDETEELPDDYEFYGGEQNGSAVSAQADGTGPMALITKTGCVTCHGADLKGGNMAPGLYNLTKYWERDGLINYLRNPSSYSGDDRFKEYKEQYNVIMPAYNNIDVKELGVIADYLLSLED